MVLRARQPVSRRPSDALTGAAVLLSAFVLVSCATHLLIAASLVIVLAVLIACGLLVLRLWLHPDRAMQCLACMLLTLPVLASFSVVPAIAVFLTMWITHVGHTPA
jgi:hypothetical protein